MQQPTRLSPGRGGLWAGGGIRTKPAGRPGGFRQTGLQLLLLSPMPSSGLTLAGVLVATSGLFCLATLFFGTRGGFYDSDDYDGNGTAH